jgi:hypothetical protein
MGQIFPRVVEFQCSSEGHMARTIIIAAPTPMLRLAVCAMVFIQAAGAKAPSDKAAADLAPTRARLDALQACLGPGDALSTLRKGLLWGWPKPGSPPSLEAPSPAPPPPGDYLDSLDRDVKACDFAATLQDADQRRQVLSAVAKDVEIKAGDCRKFGMGRKVPVTIRTLRETAVENGWQVFYKWSCASVLEPEEVRVPNLTSPANVDLPPGEYFFRAEKKNASGQVQSITPVKIVVGSAPTVPLELAVQ